LKLQFEFVTQVGLRHCFTGRYLIRGAALKNLTVNQDVCAVTGAKGFSDIVIGDEHTDTPTFEVADNIFYVIDGQRVDAGKGLIQQYERRIGGQSAGYFETTFFAA
jgi:hypothetical protein